MPRLAPLDLNALTPEQKAVADAIIQGPRGALAGPFEPWLRSPRVANPAQQLGEALRFHTTLPDDLKELAIILTGKHWKAQFEFWAHSRLGRKAGLSEAIIEAVRTGAEPPFAREVERTVYDFVTEYHATHRVSDAVYARAVEAFGEQGVVELVALMGYYGLVSATLNVFDVTVPAGHENPLA